MKRSILWTLTKLTITISVIYYLYILKFWYVVFVGIPFLITYVYGEIIDYGLIPVLKYYQFQWYLAIFLIIILGFLIFEFLYRAKRKDFLIGGEFEGRVVWIRGIRDGWIYACWDLYNYIMHKLGKKKGMVSITQDLSQCMGISPGIWPDPFGIPMGYRSETQYVVYLKRSFFQLVPERWFIDKHIDLKLGIYHVSVSNMDVKRLARPDFPGKWDYHLTGQRFGSFDVDGGLITKKNRRMLKRSNQYVELAILSDSETQKVDFVHGSRLIPYIQNEEGEFD